MSNFLARLHLIYLLLKLKVVTAWKSLWHKAKPVVVAAEAKAAPVVAKVATPSRLVRLKANWSKLDHADKIGVIAALIVAVLVGFAIHADHKAKPAAKPVVAPVVMVAIPAHLVRVSELTPEGQVFLAITVSSSAIVSATDSGITWHPTPKVTETWHGSYRISQ